MELKNWSQSSKKVNEKWSHNACGCQECYCTLLIATHCKLTSLQLVLFVLCKLK